MAAMILAAGRGERLRPVTDRIPKALVAIHGERLIDRHLRAVADARIAAAVINLGWLGEQIVDHVGCGEQFGVQAVYSPEFDEILETGGGICRALPLLGDAAFWVINADIFTDMPLPEHPLADELLAELVLVPTPAHKAHGDFDLLDGKVRNGDAPQYTFSGVARYRPAFFAAVGDGRFSVAPLLREAANCGTLGGLLYEGVWEDVGTPQRLERLNRRR